MTIFIAPKKQGGVKKTAAESTVAVQPKIEKVQPKVKAPKEYTGPRVEGED